MQQMMLLKKTVSDWLLCPSKSRVLGAKWGQAPLQFQLSAIFKSIKSELPPSLTTVTPFSKVLAAVFFILLPFVGFYLGIKYQQGITPNTVYVSKIITHTPVSTPQPQISTDGNSEKVLYEQNGFLFYYPSSLKLSQALTDAVQWRYKDSLQTGINDVFTLHESSLEMPDIKVSGKFAIWNKDFVDPITQVVITSVSEEAVKIGTNNTQLFKIECGTSCEYDVVRYSSNKKNYEVIYNLSSGKKAELDRILASFNFYDANSKNWRTYTSSEGHYVVSYPANSIFMEKVFTSVDGVRGYDKNIITVLPGNLSISFKDIGSQTLDAYLKENQCQMIDISKQVMIDNEKGMYQSTPCGVEGSSDVFVKHKNLLYRISNTSPEDPILATFKFTD